MNMVRSCRLRQAAIFAIVLLSALRMGKKAESTQMRNIIINPPKKPKHLPSKPIIVAPIMVKPYTSANAKLHVQNKEFNSPMNAFPGPMIDPYYTYGKPKRERRKLNKLLFNSTPFNFYFPQGAKKPLTWVTQVKVGPNAAKEEPILEGLRSQSELKFKTGLAARDRLDEVKSLLSKLTERVEKMENDIKLKDSQLDVMVHKFEDIQFGRG